MTARLALALALLLPGCGAEPAAPRFTFARLGGVIEGVPPGEAKQVAVSCGGRAAQAAAPRVMGEKLLLAFRWEPREACTLRWGENGKQRMEAVAPALADPVPVRVVELEGMLAGPGHAGSGESTFVLFSPSGRLLALGNQRGQVRVMEVETGKTVFERRVAEGLAKAAAFSPDERVLFIGEQTREGSIRAVELPGGREAWRYDLSKDLGSGGPRDPGNELAWVEFPGPYRMAVTPEGDLLVGGLHNWYPDPGSPVRQLSHLYRFDGRTGALRWKWPREKPAPLSLTWFSHDEKARVAVGVLGMARNWEPGLPMPPGLYAVDLGTGEERWRHPFEPLPPFKSVTTWRSVAVRPDGGAVNASTGDGRLYIIERGRARWTEARGGPVQTGGFPVVAETGLLGATRELAIFSLGGGYVPLQAAPAGASTNQPHPNSNTLLFFGWDGRLRHRWAAPNRPNGLALSADGRWLAVPLSQSRAFRREDVNALVLFDTRREGNPYAGEYHTEGPIPYDQAAISPDGSLIAVVESPAAIPDGRPPRGKSRLHILY
ncbi:MAG: PQQ-binding-like beta-propeller repeat protein [Candidatus Tectomicrobia bacterium]|uniref:PQQ-binding-like beta-propeller repeat protein n=1 Tax=Tectimicrobiota bacterium TaxID=2528274 RepID=A0A932MLM3_UNCTE|nr:PQQ-binding-like beta-propeller repeat protein [Candidatus Tectomicrobia bacterium]